MKTKIGALSALVLGMLTALATAAHAAPTPPDPVDVGNSVIAQFADKGIDILTAMATNVWVLALFGLAIVVAIVGRLKSRVSSAAKRAV